MEQSEVELVGRDIAEDTVNQWLDSKKIKPKRRNEYQSMIDNLVDAVVDGELSLDDNNCWIQKLSFPTENGEGQVTVSEIKYKHRITEVDKAPYKRVIKGSDFQATMSITLCALTSQPVGVLNALDSSTDRQIAESIAIFFV